MFCGANVKSQGGTCVEGVSSYSSTPSVTLRHTGLRGGQARWLYYAKAGHDDHSPAA